MIWQVSTRNVKNSFTMQSELITKSFANWLNYLPDTSLSFTIIRFTYLSLRLKQNSHLSVACHLFDITKIAITHWETAQSWNGACQHLRVYSLRFYWKCLLHSTFLEGNVASSIDPAKTQSSFANFANNNTAQLMEMFVCCPSTSFLYTAFIPL